MKQSASIAGILWAAMLCAVAPAASAAAPTGSDPLEPCEIRTAGTNVLAPYYCRARDFANANFAGRSLQRAVFNRTNLTGADLSRADLGGADFRCSDLTNANLAGAIATGSSYLGATLAFADFTDANLEQMAVGDVQCKPDPDFLTSNLAGVNMTRATLRGTTFVAWKSSFAPLSGYHEYPELQLLEMRRATLSGANATRVNFMQVDLRLSNFAGAIFKAVSFVGSDLSCSDFTNSTWSSSTFYQGVAAGVDFSGADLRTARFPGAQMTGAIFVDAKLDGALFGGAGLTYADFTGATIAGTDFSDANLSGATWVDGTKCMEGSIGVCKTTGNPMPPDPNASAGVPRGAAYLPWSLRNYVAVPGLSLEAYPPFHDCPYSTADYSNRPAPEHCSGSCAMQPR
ncbi:MAG: pentapeptide repeat-containing protein [Proteobacteria bacterium]|nr:pentapeptide repeat-containing protein [Pseudomonadota bacterium]